MSAYDPASTFGLSRDVARELLVQPLGPLPPTSRFTGGGVYALYYKGTFLLYTPISDPEGREGPIYVGKGQFTKSSGPAPLFGRLVAHRRSLDAVVSLHAEDFMCRYLVLVDAWIRPSEDFLVEYFRPLGNDVVKGFGNNAVGGPRDGGRVSPWDSLHPGRPGSAKGVSDWASCAPALIASHCDTHPPKRKAP